MGNYSRLKGKICTSAEKSFNSFSLASFHQCMESAPPGMIFGFNVKNVGPGLDYERGDLIVGLDYGRGDVIADALPPVKTLLKAKILFYKSSFRPNLNAMLVFHVLTMMLPCNVDECLGNGWYNVKPVSSRRMSVMVAGLPFAVRINEDIVGYGYFDEEQ